MRTRSLVVAIALLWPIAAHADSTKVVIGDIDDMSGPYADTNGPGAVEAIKMAIADFGGSVFGQRVELLTADHQNKPDIGAQKFREWADRDGLTMVMLGANTGVSLAMASIAKEKKIPFFAIGATGASLTGKDCTPYTVHYVHDTTALGIGTATAILGEGGKTWFFLTSDYAFGTQLQEAAARVVTANGGKVIGVVRVPPRRISHPISCRRRAPRRRLSPWPTAAKTPSIRSSRPRNSASSPAASGSRRRC